jgi:hypothetical protein
MSEITGSKFSMNLRVCYYDFKGDHSARKSCYSSSSAPEGNRDNNFIH